jgi:hypothetical protein
MRLRSFGCRPLHVRLCGQVEGMSVRVAQALTTVRAPRPQHSMAQHACMRLWAGLRADTAAPRCRRSVRAPTPLTPRPRRIQCSLLRAQTPAAAHTRIAAVSVGGALLPCAVSQGVASGGVAVLLSASQYRRLTAVMAATGAGERKETHTAAAQQSGASLSGFAGQAANHWGG